MGKQRNNHRREVTAPAPFEEARNELFQHIIRCGVLQAAAEHQAEWFDETMAYLEDRYPELSPEQFQDLKSAGQRFCAPPKVNTEIETADAASAA
ncbi:MAG TPA: hypothetical protein VN677_01320 [Gemmatimonadaceae bacterium]|nr:hypothetical protein [Gemmatimonadaceae bacterium]